MMLRKSFLGAASLLTVAGALSFHGCSSDESNQHETEQDPSETTGSVGLSLTLPSGVTINTVQYTVTGAGGFMRSQSINVTNSSVLRFRVGNLPAGSYTMNLVGTGPAAATNCAGSAPFTIANTGVTDLMMTLQCGSGTTTETDNGGDIIVNGDVVNTPTVTCPNVTGISALPLESLSGGGMALEASVTSTTDATFAWTGTGGTFSAGSALATNFTCAAGTGGDRTLTFTVSKSGCESRSQTVDVSCTTRVFSSSPSYLLPVASGVTTQAILTAGDQVGFKPGGTTPYRMVGLPDGLGVLDNNDGTFTLLSNHELGGAGSGVARAHGGDGAFVSKWTIRKSDLGVTKGQDLIQTVNLYNPATSSYAPASNFAFGRFCSADLAPASAWFAGGTGFNGQLFLNGEETGNEGRPMAHGLDGTSYELAWLGNASWENLLASPHPQAKTIVVGTDDSTPGQVYVYVGTKTNTGSNIDKAGLTNGTLYGIAVTGFATEPSATGIPTGPFTLASLGNASALTGATIETNSNTAGITRFNRPEDGAWDPAHPNDFYFVTTNAITAPSRLWRLRFTDIAQPELGGTVEMMLNGTEGQLMLDNMSIDARGHIMLVEDVGNNAHIGQVFRYDIATDTLTNIAQHDPNRFVTGASMFLTQDEEASGIVDATAVLGAGWWLVDVQAHYGIAGEIAEGGQYIALYDPGSL